MATNILNGATVSWTPAGGQAVALGAKLTDFSDSHNGATAEGTGAGATENTVSVGRVEEQVSISYKGTPGATVVIGGKGALAVTLPNASTYGDLASGVITSISCSGDVDNPVESSITIEPCNA